ncbi:MAG: class I tRNA ligase family protein [Candidatus Peribacteria bacterium]|nr:MAG: class I tRNA ligase family protein [Candidatus Peribacteria bacterium]
MTQSFPKHYDIASEQALYQSRVDRDFFHPEIVAAYRTEYGRQNRDESYTIILPPPNVTGKLHIGHAMMVAVEDAMVRHARMSGYRTLWLPGTDHAAISTQSVVAKKLAADGIDRFDLGRDRFLDKVREFVVEHRGHITGQLSSLGATLDRDREQYTLAEGPARAVRYAFQSLYQKGKIYQDNYVVNRSSGAQSVVSNEEVEHREEEGKLYYINYFVEGKGYSIPIATTRPETMFADVAIAVHPQDKRYKKHIGKNALIPYINKPIPIIGDEYVDVSFGTGALKITPTHDVNDFEVAKRHNLPMDQFAFDENNIFTEITGELFAGKPVADFKKNIIEYLKDIGNLDHVEEYTHTVPYCERTGCRIEPRLSQQWFMNVEHAADKCLHWLDEGEVQIYPERYEAVARKQYLEQIRPWAISRQIWR